MTGCGKHEHTYAYGAPGQEVGSEEARRAWMRQLQNVQIPAIIEAWKQYVEPPISVTQGFRNSDIEFGELRPFVSAGSGISNSSLGESSSVSIAAGQTLSMRSLGADVAEQRAMLEDYFNDPDTTASVGEGYFRIRSCEH